MWSIHMDYYSVLKGKEVLTPALLSEIIQSKKGQILDDSTYMRFLE